ncbi:hypothetical protein [Trichothermofontia sp.]
MAYSDFSLRKVLKDFSLHTQDDSFLLSVVPISPSAYLKEFLDRSLPLAVAVGTEKARSELLISPVLLEVREILHRKVSIFSGTDFTVDPTLGLNGTCDFLISQSPEQVIITAPIAVIVEAKKGELDAGLGQCIAEMIGAQKFNQQQGNSVSTIYGTVTSGSLWRFLKLENQTVTFDLKEYAMPPVEQILGILVQIASSGKE